MAPKKRAKKRSSKQINATQAIIAATAAAAASGAGYYGYKSHKAAKAAKEESDAAYKANINKIEKVVESLKTKQIEQAKQAKQAKELQIKQAEQDEKAKKVEPKPKAKGWAGFFTRKKSFGKRKGSLKRMSKSKKALIGSLIGAGLLTAGGLYKYNKSRTSKIKENKIEKVKIPKEIPFSEPAEIKKKYTSTGNFWPMPQPKNFGKRSKRRKSRHSKKR